MTVLRLMRHDEASVAADLHRRAGALIPGYDTALHTAPEFVALYRDRVFRDGPIWGAFEGDQLLGIVALLPSWIDHLDVEPTRHSFTVAELTDGARNEERMPDVRYHWQRA